MLEIKIQGEALDLAPDTVMDIEEQNPFLQLNQEIVGTFSFPFEVRATGKNNRLLNYSGTWQKKNNTGGIDAVLYDSGITIAKGVIKIERPTVHLNDQPKGSISCYFLSSAGAFYQLIKDKKMREIVVGGDRTFSGTGSPWYTSDFGVHVLNVAKGITITDYVFFPVKNELWGPDPGFTTDADVMNKVYQTEFGMTIGPIIVPFPKLKYVLTKAIEHVGWTIQGDILDDADFERIAMINFRAIDWANYREGGGGTYFMDQLDSVTFDLQDHLPNMTIGEFMVALKNRFAWWYDIDVAAKLIRIKKLSDIPAGSIKDMTSYAGPVMQKTVLAEALIYALRNNFIANSGEGIDITKLDYQGAVDGVADLPTAEEALNEQVYLVEEENNYYACLQKIDDYTVWEWQIISPNIYDYVPAGANEDITTSATTVGVVKYDDYMDLIPECNGQGVWKDFDAEVNWGIHMAFWVGWGDRKLGESGGFAYKYPQASHHVYTTLGTQFADWSLAFKGQLTDGTQVGLYDLSWKPFLDLINTSEEAELTIYLPLHLYLQLQFTDVLIVDGVKLFIKNKRVQFPYRGMVQPVCTRVA